jgi:bacillithiol system protein YtxJ
MRALESVTDLDEAIRASHTRPILILKHSATCGISAAALEEVEEVAELTALDPPIEAFVVSVQFGAEVSAAIANRFRLRHESPQALIVHKGILTWHASHFHVTRDEIASALEAIVPVPKATR